MRYQCTECFHVAESPKDPIFADCYERGHSIQTISNKKDESTAKKLYEIASKKIKKLVISQNNTSEVYAIVAINGHVESLNLKSSRATHWLNQVFLEVGEQEIYSQDTYKNVINTIIARAQISDIKKENVYSRIAFKDRELYYDLGTTDWKIVRVTGEEIDIIPYKNSLPIFRRTQTIAEQTIPKFDDRQAITKLTKLLHIPEKDRQIFEVHLVTLVLESVPIPIMGFTGEAGSLKTTKSATVKRIIDPNGTRKEDNCTSFPTKNDDLVLQLYNRYLCAFDNVTRITQEVSDTLCRAITGANNQRRELYTNLDEVILAYKRKLVINGIVPNLDYPDLQDRIILYDKKHITENDRLTDEEFTIEFEKLLGFVLGNIFETLKQAINLYDTVKSQIRPKTRLADFEIWGESISRALGYESNSFLTRYYEKLGENAISAQDSHPIVTVIEHMLKDKAEYENSALGCLNDCRETANQIGIDVKSPYVKFPKAPNQISKELTIVAPVLQKLGINLEIGNYTKSDCKYTKNSTVITIRKTIEKSASPTSLTPFLK